MSASQPVTTLMTILMAVMFFLNIWDPVTFNYLFVLNGKTFETVFPWQFVTYMFLLPPSIFSIFNILIFFWFGSSLENHWGSKMFGLFLVIAILGNSAASFLLGFVPLTGGWSVDICMLIAFGFSFPHEVIYLMFIIPVRVKILAIIGLVFIGVQLVFTLDGLFVTGQLYTDALVSLPYSVANILHVVFSYIAIVVFSKYIFGGGHVRQAVHRVKNRKRFAKVQAERKQAHSENQQYKRILEKHYKGEPLSEKERKLIGPLPVSDPAMCDPADFHEGDEHCLKCDLFGNCVKRVLD